MTRQPRTEGDSSWIAIRLRSISARRAAARTARSPGASSATSRLLAGPCLDRRSAGTGPQTQRALHRRGRNPYRTTRFQKSCSSPFSSRPSGPTIWMPMQSRMIDHRLLHHKRADIAELREFCLGLAADDVDHRRDVRPRRGPGTAAPGRRGLGVSVDPRHRRLPRRRSPLRSGPARPQRDRHLDDVPPEIWTCSIACRLLGGRRLIAAAAAGEHAPCGRCHQQAAPDALRRSRCRRSASTYCRSGRSTTGTRRGSAICALAASRGCSSHRSSREPFQRGAEASRYDRLQRHRHEDERLEERDGQRLHLGSSPNALRARARR